MRPAKPHPEIVPPPINPEQEAAFDHRTHPTATGGLAPPPKAPGGARRARRPPRQAAAAAWMTAPIPWTRQGLRE